MSPDTNLQNYSQVANEPFELNYTLTQNNELQVDFQDNLSNFSQFYDTTRLVIDPRQITNINGNILYNCKVSWYGKSDCQTFDEKSGTYCSRRSLDYSDVLIDLDLNLLRYDKEYVSVMMKELLKESRVKQYIQSGLEENPQLPCGNYIGAVAKYDNVYRKTFDPQIGSICHNSNAIIAKRETNRRKFIEEKQKQIAEKRQQIEKLQSDIDEMYH